MHFRKDVRLPYHMQRAMAAEAEASREARAKVMKLNPTRYLTLNPWGAGTFAGCIVDSYAL